MTLFHYWLHYFDLFVVTLTYIVNQKGFQPPFCLTDMDFLTGHLCGACQSLRCSNLFVRQNKYLQFINKFWIHQRHMENQPGTCSKPGPFFRSGPIVNIKTKWSNSPVETSINGHCLFTKPVLIHCSPTFFSTLLKCENHIQFFFSILSSINLGVLSAFSKFA